MKVAEKPRASVRSRKPVKVAVVGQIPPPMNGQSLMIQQFLQGSYSSISLVHVPMRFSRSNKEIGLFSLRKVGALLETLFHILEARFRFGAKVLYYPPAGANLIPVMRDIFLLTLSRPFFSKTVFHFHAAGLADIYGRLPTVLRPLYRVAYARPNLAIFTTRATSAEAAELKAEEIAIVPCGAPDASSAFSIDDFPIEQALLNEGARPVILFAGILCEGKGVLVLLEACKQLRNEGIDFDVRLLGEFQTAAFEQQVQKTIAASGLEGHVHLPGIVVGKNKARAFRLATLFCFPSHYAAESFGVVLIEAMSFSLPIVATDWQGIPEVTGRDGEGALLVPAKDSGALAEALASVLLDAAKRRTMGTYNRQRYLDHFTLETYRNSLEACLAAVE